MAGGGVEHPPGGYHGDKDLPARPTNVHVHGARGDFDLARDFDKYLENPKCAQWDQLMRTFQEVVPEAKPGELRALMEPVYELK